MIRAVIAAAIIVSLAVPAFAQQQLDPALLQRLLGAVRAQRDAGFDSAAIEKARADGLAEDLAKAQAHIKELESAQAKKE